jgi:hypothetical protein
MICPAGWARKNNDLQFFRGVKISALDAALLSI